MRSKASRQRACWRRLPTKPATSRADVHGRLAEPRRAARSRARSRRGSVVFALDHLDERERGTAGSTSGCRRCGPCGSPSRDVADAHHGRVGREDRVRLRRLVEPREDVLLQLEVLGRGLEDPVGVGDRVLEVGVERDGHVGAVRGDAAGDARERLRERVVDGHVEPALREDLRDAVAHQAGARRPSPRSACCVSAVDIQDLSGHEAAPRRRAGRRAGRSCPRARPGGRAGCARACPRGPPCPGPRPRTSRR